MSTRIRLRRMGANKRPYYRVVVADQRRARDGRFIENIGKYHPLEDPSLIEIDQERALHWLRVGAQPSDQVRNLMVKTGIWDAFVAERPSAAKLVPQKGPKPEKPKLSKKAAAKAAAGETARAGADESAASAASSAASVAAIQTEEVAEPEAIAETAAADAAPAEEAPDAPEVDVAAAADAEAPAEES